MARAVRPRYGIRSRPPVLPLLRETGGDAAPTEGEILFELAGENPENLLFGRFGRDEVMSRFSRAGILAALERLGFSGPLLTLACADPSDQRVLLHAGPQRRDRLLLEARLERRLFRLDRPLGILPAGSAFRMLIIHWLCLSDPDRGFDVARPRLPGQERPGLRLLAPCLSLLDGLAADLLLDGVLGVAEHYHTAIMYARRFRFLDPAAEGRFRAIERDLTGIPLALASEAVALGSLVALDGRSPLPWTPAEQVMAAGGGALARHLGSRRYREAAEDAARALRTAVDWDHYRARIAESGRAGKYP